MTLAKRWLALYVLCTGVLMIVLDTTVIAETQMAGKNPSCVSISPGLARRTVGARLSIRSRPPGGPAP